MGVVYLAQDPRLKRQVAIKLLPPDLTRDETAKQRFLQEAKAASALSRRHEWGRLKATVHRLPPSGTAIPLCERPSRVRSPLLGGKGIGYGAVAVNGATEGRV